MIINLPTEPISSTSLKQTFLRALPTRWRRKPAGIDVELNYVTVILCIVTALFCFSTRRVNVSTSQNPQHPSTNIVAAVDVRKTKRTCPAFGAHFHDAIL